MKKIRLIVFGVALVAGFMMAIATVSAHPGHPGHPGNGGGGGGGWPPGWPGGPGGGGCGDPTPTPTSIPPTATPSPTATPLPTPPPPPVIELCGDPTTVVLYGGQTIETGSVTVGNDEENLYVQFQTTGGWVMDQTHLAVATSLDGIPQNGGGNPQIGQFPYATTHNPTVTDFTYTISLADAGYTPGDELYIAAHASLLLLDDNGGIIQQETGWGDGIGFPGNSWAMYFNFTVQSCVPEPPPPPVPGIILPGDFRTQTQGGWGSTAHGNNPGVYRDTNYAAAFPSGVTTGDSAALSAWFTTATAVRDYLPQGGPAASFDASYVDPTTTSAGVLGGQVLALSLSVGFDLYDADFGASDVNLRDLVVVDTASICYGMTVQAVLDEANAVLAGGGSLGASDVNSCTSRINENFVDGTTVGDYLGLPALTMGDINWDGYVTITDVSLMIADFGASCSSPTFAPVKDLNHDCNINIFDVSTLTAHFGQ